MELCMRRFDLIDEYTTVYAPFRPQERPSTELENLTPPAIRKQTVRRWLSLLGIRCCRTTSIACDQQTGKVRLRLRPLDL